MDYSNVFENVKSVAVLGLSDKPYRDSGRVAAYLLNNGFNVYGVNPFVNNFGSIQVYSSLHEIPNSIDLIDVFVNSEKLSEFIDDILLIKPKYLWLQLGIENITFEKTMSEHGIIIIKNACIMTEHARCC